MGNSILWIKNVRLETGYKQLENDTVETTTDLFSIKVVDGKISDIISAKEAIEGECIDAKELLAVPTMKEMHNHLDKTYLSLDWKACRPVKNLSQRLQYEAEELVELADTTKHRASKMIELLLSRGTTHIRTHVNIDPYIGLKNLEGVREALESYQDRLTYEIVAFPQHGLLRENVPQLMKEAMRSGAHLVGGLDPAGIDKNIEKSLFEVMSMAEEFNADIDIHLHDGGHVGWYTIDKLIEMTEEAKWHNRVAVSHAFSLGDISTAQSSQMAERLSEVGISIMSTVPIRNVIPPIDLLNDKGVNVYFGCDGFYDSWSPLGTGDLVEKVTRFCEITGKSDELSLGQSLKFATGGVNILSKDGNVQWPKVGDEASMVLVNASCAAELVARKPKREAVIFKGKVVAGEIPDYTMV